ncbi:MAG: hypothetical protein ACFCU5_15385 [Pleurocapsa sp.]
MLQCGADVVAININHQMVELTKKGWLRNKKLLRFVAW